MSNKQDPIDVIDQLMDMRYSDLEDMRIDHKPYSIQAEAQRAYEFIRANDSILIEALYALKYLQGVRQHRNSAKSP